MDLWSHSLQFATTYPKFYKITIFLEGILSPEKSQASEPKQRWGPLSHQHWLSVSSQQGWQLDL